MRLNPGGKNQPESKIFSCLKRKRFSEAKSDRHRMSEPNKTPRDQLSFVVHHPFKSELGRRRFIDQLFVAHEQRNQGVANALLLAIAREPLELIVDRENDPALGLYSKVGFSEYDKCVYPPKKTEMAMSTESFVRTRKLLREHPRKYEENDMRIKTLRKSELTQEMRRAMIEAVSTAHNITIAEATRRVCGLPEDEMYYTIALP